MSGAHSQHRTPNRPQFDELGNPVFKVDNYGRVVMRHRLIPGEVSANGRPTEYQVFEYPAQRHVLDYSPAPHFPSKHARGRMRPRTPREQRRAQNLQARFIRASKRVTLLQQRGAIFDEMQTLAA